MKVTRAFLRWFAVAGIFLSIVAFCLAAFNLVNTDPIDLHRLRDLFIAFCIFTFLFLISQESPGRETSRIVARCRFLLNHPKAFSWIVGVMLLLYLIDACTQHLAFQTASHDFSMIDEAVYSAARGGLLFSPILGRSFLSEHFSPILFVIAPLHRLVGSPWLLVLLQPLLLWAAVFPFRAILTRFTGLTRWQNNLLCLVLLNHALMISTLEYLFHMESALPLLLFTTIYFAERKRYILYACGIVGILCIKEDMGIYLASLGIFYALLRKRRAMGLLTIAVGLTWTLLAIKVAMPSLYGAEAGDYQFVSRWESWGNSPVAILLGFAKQPIRLASSVFNEDVLLLLFSLMFIPLLKPKKGYWIVFVLPWLINTTSDFNMQSELELYYGLPILSFMLVAVLFGLQDKAIAWPRTPRMSVALAASLLVLNCCHFELPHIPRTRITILKRISELPETQQITASACLFPVLGYEREKTLIGQLVVPSSEYVLLKQGDGSWPLAKEQSYTYADLCLNNGYSRLWEHEDFTCFKKRTGQQTAAADGQ